MDSTSLFALLIMGLAAATTVFGAIMPARAQGQSVVTALDAIARQPDASDRISRTLFIGLAMIESLAIYALVISLILLFANPFQALVTRQP